MLINSRSNWTISHTRCRFSASGSSILRQDTVFGRSPVYNFTLERQRSREGNSCQVTRCIQRTTFRSDSHLSWQDYLRRLVRKIYTSSEVKCKFMLLDMMLIHCSSRSSSTNPTHWEFRVSVILQLSRHKQSSDEYCLMIAYGVKLEVTEARNFPCVDSVHRLRELRAMMRFSLILYWIEAGPPPPWFEFLVIFDFLHHGIEKVKRHLLWKFHKKNQRKSWSNVPPKLLACLRFVYKVVDRKMKVLWTNSAQSSVIDTEDSRQSQRKDQFVSHHGKQRTLFEQKVGTYLKVQAWEQVLSVQLSTSGVLGHTASFVVLSVNYHPNPFAHFLFPTITNRLLEHFSIFSSSKSATLGTLALSQPLPSSPPWWYAIVSFLLVMYSLWQSTYWVVKHRVRDTNCSFRWPYKVVHKSGRLRKFNRAREIEFNFFLSLGLSVWNLAHLFICSWLQNLASDFLIFASGLVYGLSKSKKRGKIITKLWKIITGHKLKNLRHRCVDLPFFFHSAKIICVYRN